MVTLVSVINGFNAFTVAPRSRCCLSGHFGQVRSLQLLPWVRLLSFVSFVSENINLHSIERCTERRLTLFMSYMASMPIYIKPILSFLFF